jgi:phosphate:Na+ symporter
MRAGGLGWPVEETLAFTTNLEHAGDVVCRNLLDHAAKRLKRNTTLTSQQSEELTSIIARLVTNLRAAAAVFMTEDLRAARMLAGEKETFRNMEAVETEAHFGQIRSGQAEAAAASAWRLDLLRDLKRINDHLIASAAYPVLKNEGELLPSRLRESD